MAGEGQDLGSDCDGNSTSAGVIAQLGGLRPRPVRRIPLHREPFRCHSLAWRAKAKTGSTERSYRGPDSRCHSPAWRANAKTGIRRHRPYGRRRGVEPSLAGEGQDARTKPMLSQDVECYSPAWRVKAKTPSTSGRPVAHRGRCHRPSLAGEGQDRRIHAVHGLRHRVMAQLGGRMPRSQPVVFSPNLGEIP